MPRNGSGTYTLPTGNPVEPNTVIEAEWANTTLDDIGNEITDSLSRTGEGGMLAPLRFYSGSSSVPGIAWLDETSTGFYRAGAGEFWATVLGTEVVQFTDNGVLIPAGVDLTVEGNVDFQGTFDVLGNFEVNTDKFVVLAASGNTSIAGTLGVTGAITATGGVSGAVTSSSVTITGGTINGTSVGATTASSGAFTTLSASGAFSLTGDQVQVSEGGTGATTAAGARTAILPSYTSNALKFLRVNSGATDVEWATEPSLGTVTSVDVSGGTTGLTSSGGPITTSGTITLAGTLIVGNGGTGVTTLTGIVKGNGTSAFSAATAGTDYVAPGGALGTPSSGTLTNCTSLPLSTGVTGTLAATNGGTAQSTWTTGDLLYSSATNTLSKLGIGTTGQILKVSGGIPSWATDTGTGTVTSIDVSGGTTGLTTSGGPITTSGTITLAGTLAVANGGTGQTSYTNGQLLIGNTTGNTLTKATLTAGSGISITNGAGSITIATSGGGTGTVTSIDVSGGTTGLTTSGGPVTSSGTITLAGTLAVANGGTGVTSSTGTGSVVLSTSPTLVTPTLGVASATSVNKVAITAPATSATLTIADGKTLTANNSLTLAGTDSTTMTFPSSSATVAGLGIAQTFTAKQTFTGSTSVLAAAFTNVVEPATVSATAATGTINYDVTTQSVLYYTSNASANWTVNFRASSGTSLNTAMATGDVMTVTFLVTQGTTAYYNSAVQVDGNSVTPKYQGGTAWTAGNVSGIDIYTYTIIKTGSAAFTVLASQTQFK